MQLRPTSGLALRMGIDINVGPGGSDDAASKAAGDVVEKAHILKSARCGFSA